MLRKIFLSIICAILSSPIFFILTVGLLQLIEIIKDLAKTLPAKIFFVIAFIIIVIFFYNLFSDLEEKKKRREWE